MVLLLERGVNESSTGPWSGPVLIRTEGRHSQPFPRTFWAEEVEVVLRRAFDAVARTSLVQMGGMGREGP